MKISSSAYNHPKTASSRDVTAILPLVPIEETEAKSDQMISHTLRSSPADTASPKYKVNVRILQGDEDCRTIIKWSASVQKVCHGLNVTTHSPAIPIVETLMTGTPLSLFQAGVTKAKTANMDRRIAAAVLATDVAAGEVVRRAGIDDPANLDMNQIVYGLGHVVTQLLPRRVLPRVKRYLRRECRKPRDMKVRTYFQHVLRVNIDELPSLPPFGGAQSLSNDEILDILLFGTPRSWQKEMERQGFDPMNGTVADTLEFMERLEATDDFDGSPVKNNSKTNTKKGGGNNKKPSSSSDGKKGHCMIHGEGNHNSDECYTLQKEAKKLKSSHSGNTSGKAKDGSGNKTWNRKADHGKQKAKSDLAAFIGKEVAKGIKKHKQSNTATPSKKRKNDSDNDEGEDLHMIDLEGFNYADMEDLKIESESEDDNEEASC
jgi:hypothetical protein